ncbi:hypothetical protein XIS1_480063 [Xenorhabdus innexi]|uniref:Uncharacterized protein n=1 Tax=Xenorhabdus innexi TaxID=290109 RepID=A0A1N6MYQ7_9GAMM|nr:hypothetical protein XIS1_480063 [Xenorhabdus innexi]
MLNIHQEKQQIQNKKPSVMGTEADFIWFGNIFYTFHAFNLLSFMSDKTRSST